MARRSLIVALSLIAPLAGAPSAAATIRASTSLVVDEDATRIVVRLASTKRLLPKERPRSVSVRVGTRLISLRARRAGAAAVSLGTWRSSPLGAEAAALAGMKVVIRVRSRAGTVSVRSTVRAPRPVTPPPPPPPAAPSPPPPPPAPDASTAQRALGAARTQLGAPFTYGGSSPETGFDSPGLTQWAFGQGGFSLPRTAEDQYRVGAAVDGNELAPGDLVFFQDATGYIDHVGIVSAENEFIHAQLQGGVVKYSTLSEPYYATRYAGARRVG